MDRTNDTTKHADKFGTGKHGFRERTATDAPTRFRATDADAHQEEILAIIEAAGLTPDASNLGQAILGIDRILEMMCLMNYDVISNSTATTFQVGMYAELNGVNRWYAFGGGNTHADFGTSADAVSWDVTNTGAGGQIRACCRAEFLDASGRGIVACGIGGGLYTGDADAASFTLTTQTPAGSYSSTFRAIAASSAEVIVVGDGGEIQRSTDGTVWASMFSSAEDVRGVAYNGSLFCAVGTTGLIYTSPTGMSWTSRTPDSSYAGDFLFVIWDERLGLFIAGGTSGEIQTSPTGTTWTRRRTGGVTLVEACSLGQRVMVLDNDDDYLYSYDALTWTALPVSFGDAAAEGINGFGTDGRSLIALGERISDSIVLRYMQRPKIV